MAIRLMRWKLRGSQPSGEPATGRPTGCPSAPALLGSLPSAGCLKGPNTAAGSVGSTREGSLPSAGGERVPTAAAGSVGPVPPGAIPSAGSRKVPTSRRASAAPETPTPSQLVMAKCVSQFKEPVRPTRRGVPAGSYSPRLGRDCSPDPAPPCRHRRPAGVDCRPPAGRLPRGSKLPWRRKEFVKTLFSSWPTTRTGVGIVWKQAPAGGKLRQNHRGDERRRAHRCVASRRSQESPLTHAHGILRLGDAKSQQVPCGPGALSRASPPLPRPSISRARLWLRQRAACQSHPPGRARSP